MRKYLVVQIESLFAKSDDFASYLLFRCRGCVQVSHTSHFIITYLAFQCMLANVHNKCDVKVKSNNKINLEENLFVLSKKKLDFVEIC